MNGVISSSLPPCSTEHSPPISVEIRRGLAGFLELEAEWDALISRAALPHNVFQVPGFLAHWTRHYANANDELILVCGFVGRQLSMIWPLVKRKRHGVAILTFMGAPIAQFFDLILDACPQKHDLMRQGWSAIRELGADLFLARNVRDDAHLCGGDMFKATVLPDATTAPYARMKSRVHGDEPGTAYSSRERSNYRRRVRRLQECASVDFEAVVPGERGRLLARAAIGFKRRSLLKKAIWSPTIMDGRFGDFFEAIASDPRSALRVSVINCDHKPVGIDLSLDYGGHTFGHVLAFDPDFPAEGIGSILVQRAFISAAARGTAIFELMAPADRYKMQHADGEIGVSSLAVAFTTRGRLYEAYLARVQPLARKVAKRTVGPLIARFLGRRNV